ncbi:MAG: hypothetical protein GX661_07215 [Acholeplasmataceae bacterium]|nr:hypothetical protein [Acholeplasmataceae bacterium]
MNVIYEIFSAILILGLLFYILNEALKNLKYKIRGLINLIVSLVLSVAVGVTLWLDYRGGSLLQYYYYFVFIGVALIYGFAYAYYQLKYVRRTSRLNKRIISKYYFTDYLYVVYRFENNFYLQKNKDKYQGIVLKLGKSDFHDSMLLNLNKRLQISKRFDINKVGKYTERLKRKVYYCYVIDLLEQEDISGLEMINAYNLINVNQNDFDKEILYRIILGEVFDIEK